ncbi:hypothetical protein AMBR_JPGBJEAN_02783 [Lacticaseibacillus rhamnosus]|nr:hypothetical protein AMBR_JPGBJEAN_02783 [Lacticaseibacillus rhamnosus]
MLFVIFFFFLFVFFFQAEDGIRDCLLSRGLGDVYKRQARHGYFDGDNAATGISVGHCFDHEYLGGFKSDFRIWLVTLPQIVAYAMCLVAVSYTHLTLPTILLV